MRTGLQQGERTANRPFMDGGILSFAATFKAPKKYLGDLDAEAAAALISAASDIALVVDENSIIRDVSFHAEDLANDLDEPTRWVGRKWADVVTVESRPKVASLLSEAALKATRWRQLNHASVRGPDVPILYSAVQAGNTGRIVAFGRDLRAVSAVQQRLVDAQQLMERDYSRLRHVEMRYRLLFHMSSEAVMVVDAATQKVLEANPAAMAMFGDAQARLIGQGFLGLFAGDTGNAMQILLGGVRAAGRADDIEAQLAEGSVDVRVSASLFRQEAATFFLVRLFPARVETVRREDAKVQSKLLKLVESGPDGFVITEPDGDIIVANAAFLEMAQLTSEEQARGESLERWLGRPGVDMNVLIANLRQRGSVRLFATTLRGDFGATAEVEISAVSVANGGDTSYGFAIRNIGLRLTAGARPTRELPRSIEQLTELIGRVSLKELVRESTDVIERLCIEAALEITGDNRASAAEMLGLSRQSLYVKLRRYGLGDLSEQVEM
jgi:transcriptional regulator PpsR